MLEVAAPLALLVLAVVVSVSRRRTAALERQLAAMESRLRMLERAQRGQPPEAEAPVPPLPPSRPPRAADAPSLPPTVPELPRNAAPHEAPADLEAILGERWMLYAGLLVLLLGVAFFLKYAFEQAWIDPPVRCAVGAMAGVALIPIGLRIAGKGYDRYGHLIAGAGTVVLYLTAYAAMNLYSLIGPAGGAGALLLTTATGAVLADRGRSLPLALLAVVGAYATPLLVGGTRDAQLTLFSYLTLLNAATIYLAHRRQWPQLSAAAYAGTVLVVSVWAGRFYSPDAHLRTELFLTLYCAMFVRALAGMRRAAQPLLVPLLATAPVLYYLASLHILGDFRLELFIYLILFSGAALALSVAYRLDGLRLLAWAAAALPFLARIELTGPAWTTAMLATAAAIGGMHLAAQVHRLRKGVPVAAVDVILLHGNGLFACAAGYMVLEDQWLAGAPWLAWGLGAGFGMLSWSIRRFNLEAALHWGALALALFATGVALRFDGPWVIVATAAEGAGVVWIGLRVGRTWFRTAGLAALALACVQWLFFVGSAPPISLTFLLNERTLAGAFIVALVYAVAFWHRRAGSDAERVFSPAVVAAQILTVGVLTVEASAFWEVRALSRFDARVASQLSISLLWAAYAAALVVVGLRRRYPPVRYVGMALFGLTIAKVFVSDFSLLAGVHRVVGFLVVGAVLVLVSFLYQRASARSTAGDVGRGTS